MEIEQKKKHIIRCIKLGMDLNSSMIVSQCTNDEMELLESDEGFIREIKFRQHLMEAELLDKHRLGRNLAVTKGNTKPIEWMLERVNKERWSSKSDSGNEAINIEHAIVYLPEKNNAE